LSHTAYLTTIFAFDSGRGTSL